MGKVSARSRFVSDCGSYARSGSLWMVGTNQPGLDDMSSVEAVVGEERAEKRVSAVPRAEVVDGVAPLCVLPGESALGFAP